MDRRRLIRKDDGKRHVRPDRFEPGSFLVTNGRGEVLAKGFESEEEASAWIKRRGT